MSTHVACKNQAASALAGPHSACTGSPRTSATSQAMMQPSKHHMLCKWCDAHHPSMSAGSAASAAPRGLPAAPAAAALSAGRPRPGRPRAMRCMLELRSLCSEGHSTTRSRTHRGRLQGRDQARFQRTRARAPWSGRGRGRTVCQLRRVCAANLGQRLLHDADQKVTPGGAAEALQVCGM